MREIPVRHGNGAAGGPFSVGNLNPPTAMSDAALPATDPLHEPLLIWADKTALILAMAWGAIMLVLWALSILACGWNGALLLAQDTGLLALEMGFLFVAPVWLALRGLDALFKGPRRRKARASFRASTI
jgi:hypothetical protein